MKGHAVSNHKQRSRVRRRWLRRRRIRTKLAIILVLPVLAIVVLTGLNVVSAAGRAAQAGEARELVALGGTSARLTVALQHERAAAALVFAEPGSAAAVADYQRQASATDAEIAVFDSDMSRAPGGVRPLLDRIRAELSGLAVLRQKVAAAPDAVLSVVVFRYRAVIADLIGFRQTLGQVAVAASTANGLRSVAALSQAIESHSQLQVAAVRAMAGEQLTPAGQQEIVAAAAGITEALQTFGDLGPPTWQGMLNSRIGAGAEILAAERLQGVVTRARPGSRLELGTDPRGWSQAMGTRIDRMHAVEAELDAQMLAAVTVERDAQQRTIAIWSGIVAALLLIVLVLVWIVARSLTGSLSRLQASAMDVAKRRLPSMVAKLDADNADPATIKRLMAEAAEAIRVDGTDEIGQVAVAFNAVNEAAVRIAGEQAALRAGVSAILVSLARRLQRRADAMMVSLDALQRDEQDPDRLQKLFTLDHIATLIRRLIANLQILAGGRGGSPREGEVALTDLLRAAAQEIDHWKRVEPTDVDDGVHISGEVADELIHLLAELFDNAAQFSPPASQVSVAARCVGDQLHIQIHDQGTGMTDDQLDAVRERLANPRRIDHRTTRQMGLPVVGAVAHRLRINVAVRSTRQEGTTVDLTVPGTWFVRAVLHERTRQLTPITATMAAPPPWPMPAAAAQDVTAEPVIFQQLQREPAGSWFHPPGEPNRQPSGATTHEAVDVPAAGWAAAALAANAAATVVATTTTPSGLPQREPLRRAFPMPELAAVPPLPVQRKPEQLRRQMSAFQHGVGLAGRRDPQHRPEDNR